jgi:TPR repeat protein
MRMTAVVALVAVGSIAAASAWADSFGDGIGAARKGDYVTALMLLQPLADQGNAEAQFAIGNLCDTGKTIMDPAKAAQWYRRAAEQGYPEAENNLGALYSNGEGVPHDHGQALKWWQLAAEQGLPTAQANLADLLADGDGVPQDLVQAYKWSGLAAEQGEPRANDILSRVSMKMTPDQITAAERLIQSWMPTTISGI